MCRVMDLCEVTSMAAINIQMTVERRRDYPQIRYIKMTSPHYNDWIQQITIQNMFVPYSGNDQDS